VGALEFKFWKAACEVFDRPDWVQRHWQRGQLPGSSDCAALRAEVAQLVASQPLAVWSERFAQRDACVTPVLTLEEAQAHPLFADGARSQPWAEITG
jgi:crotonobetainyl-CoA:carnitine CoA-transferase CaiB-like acyl-CoA transferase